MSSVDHKQVLFIRDSYHNIKFTISLPPQPNERKNIWYCHTVTQTEAINDLNKREEPRKAETWPKTKWGKIPLETNNSNKHIWNDIDSDVSPRLLSADSQLSQLEFIKCTIFYCLNSCKATIRQEPHHSMAPDDKESFTTGQRFLKAANEKPFHVWGHPPHITNRSWPKFGIQYARIVDPNAPGSPKFNFMVKSHERKRWSKNEHAAK